MQAAIRLIQRRLRGSRPAKTKTFRPLVFDDTAFHGAEQELTAKSMLEGMQKGQLISSASVLTQWPVVRTSVNLTAIIATEDEDRIVPHVQPLQLRNYALDHRVQVMRQSSV